MKNRNRTIGLISLFITYVVVKIVHELAGFEYNFFREGITTIKFLVDITSWFIVYALIFTLVKKLMPQKDR